jgi:hypothetical protein
MGFEPFTCYLPSTFLTTKRANMLFEINARRNQYGYIKRLNFWSTANLTLIRTNDTGLERKFTDVKDSN